VRARSPRLGGVVFGRAPVSLGGGGTARRCGSSPAEAMTGPIAIRPLLAARPSSLDGEAVVCESAAKPG
jgi:hypothetical protein